MTFPYWITVPSSFLFSESFCFFSKSAACWEATDDIKMRAIKIISDFMSVWIKQAQKMVGWMYECNNNNNDKLR